MLGVAYKSSCKEDIIDNATKGSVWEADETRPLKAGAHGSDGPEKGKQLHSFEGSHHHRRCCVPRTKKDKRKSDSYLHDPPAGSVEDYLLMEAEPLQIQCCNWRDTVGSCQNPYKIHIAMHKTSSILYVVKIGFVCRNTIYQQDETIWKTTAKQKNKLSCMGIEKGMNGLEWMVSQILINSYFNIIL